MYTVMLLINYLLLLCGVIVCYINAAWKMVHSCTLIGVIFYSSIFVQVTERANKYKKILRKENENIF